MREARKRALVWAARHDRAWTANFPSTGECTPLTVIGVYRARNSALVERLLAPCLRDGASVGLWALDEAPAALVPHTVGVGPGQRFDLLNEILRRRPAGDEDYIVVTDDDVVVPAGLPRFVGVARLAGLDLAMPAHVPYSHYSHELTRRHRLATVRLTTYVEIGPVLAISPAWRSRVTPFPEDAGLGWGVELGWMALRAEGCRLGIVDATPLLHTVRPGQHYDPRIEQSRLVRALRAAGVTDVGTVRQQVDSIQAVTATWRRWRAQPAWSAR